MYHSIVGTINENIKTYEKFFLEQSLYYIQGILRLTAMPW